ncbi:MAG: alpha/beta fold hydrolase [Gammaproteobacteria bacterium]
MRAGTVFLLGILAGFTGVAAALDERDLQPPGDFASVDTHRLYYRCIGHGAPTVVFDAGIGGAAVEWTRIQDALAGDTRVCTYDRAGYGWSDPGPAPRSTAQAVAELRRLLRAIDARPPHVLVGHSFGGFNARYFAAQHPDEVAALVLLDSSHPGMRMPRGGTGGAAGNPLVALPDEPAGPAPEVAIAQYLNSRRKAVFTQMHEMHEFDRSAEQVERAGPLPQVPLFVVARDATRGHHERRHEARWQQLQRDLATLAPSGVLRVARGSGHEIHRDRPDLVIEVVREAVSRARAARRTRPPS